MDVRRPPGCLLDHPGGYSAEELRPKRIAPVRDRTQFSSPIHRRRGIQETLYGVVPQQCDTYIGQSRSIAAPRPDLSEGGPHPRVPGKEHRGRSDAQFSKKLKNPADLMEIGRHCAWPGLRLSQRRIDL